MATKSVLKTSASALLALLLGTAALLPAGASAQERPDRGERGSGRMERSAQPSMPRPERAQAPSQPQSQAPSWQSRGPASNPQPNWSAGRPAWSQGNQSPRPSGDGGRPTWQGGDRERGDRGNGANPAGQPTFGRPAWSQGSQTPRPGTTTPSWQGRNPTYVDPSRGNNAGRPADGRGMAWNQDKQGRWYHSENGTWRQDRNGQWTNSDRRDNDGGWDRDRNGRGWQQNRGNNSGYNNGWRGGNNRWGYNNGNNWRSWDRDSWRRDNRYDWYGWRNRHRSTFSLGFYSAPWRDYSYSRFSIGVVIGAPFYDQRYWIADPWAYRLPPADGPYRWVRYYDDALLVDIYSGQVVDVIYDIFY